jgi:hypothetical protein
MLRRVRHERSEKTLRNESMLPAYKKDVRKMMGDVFSMLERLYGADTEDELDWDKIWRLVNDLDEAVKF